MTAVVDAEDEWVSSTAQDEGNASVVYDDDDLEGDDGVGTTYHQDDDIICADLDEIPAYRVGCVNSTQMLINLLNMCGWADGQLLPATFRAMEIDLGFTPASLGLMHIDIMRLLDSCHVDSLLMTSQALWHSPRV